MLLLRIKNVYANFLFREMKIKIILLLVMQVEQVRLVLAKIIQIKKMMLLMLQVGQVKILLAIIIQIGKIILLVLLIMLLVQLLVLQMLLLYIKQILIIVKILVVLVLATVIQVLRNVTFESKKRICLFFSWKDDKDVADPGNTGTRWKKTKMYKSNKFVNIINCK